MIVRKDATDNFAATEDDDFDALLNASSLGAPHVVAETEPIPADVRRRLSQAAARSARRAATSPAPKEANCDPGDFHGRLPIDFEILWRKLRQPAVVVLVGQLGSGKTASALNLLRELTDSRPTACSAASPTWRQKVWQRVLQDCGHLAWEPWASFGMGDVEPIAWPVGCGGSRRGALLLGSFSRNTFCTPHADPPLYVRDNLPASQAPRRVLRPAQMTDLLSLGQAAPAAHAVLPRPEPGQEAPQRKLVLLDCCGHARNQVRPALAPFPSWSQQPGWRGAEYGPLLGLPSSDGLSSLHTGFPPRPVGLHTYGRSLPTPLPSAGTRRRRDLMFRGEAWSLRADDAMPDGYRDSCWRQDKAANTSQSVDPLLVYFAGHGLSAACTPPRREPVETWPELMWTEQVDDGAIEHAVVPMIVHQKKGGKQAEVPVRVTYRSGDPYAVETLFYRGDPGEEVVWSFARDLLVEGLQHSGGEGDVTVWTPPDPPTQHAERRTFIQLSSPEGTALLSASHAQLKRFVDKTLLLVAAGTEHQRFGSTLDRLESELGELTCPGFGD
ncbi:SsgA family sporulation/cell division regulator [Streptomyces sp. NPDC001083]|uniref:SsgA family sporulation/cell division regulator n=1 Tax=Streptomyces sp. NPDC001083 TaxID=3364545 RepID=UPI0036C0E750